ncbi:MAG: DeoR/GlpR family DNA-binding transcription regulator [Lachnospiraceae bacterium]
MLKKERQLYILELVEQDGRATTNDLTAELGVAEDTIRKDFQELSAQGKVKRIHGGVLRIEKGLLDFEDRIVQQSSVKEQLAKKATEMIVDKHVLYIDGGTTNLKFAEALPPDFAGSVITNSPAIALALCKLPNIVITLIGGNLERTTKIVEGSSAIHQIQEMNIECCILGVSSLSPQSGITFPSSGEALLKREVINRSEQVIVIANKEKLGTVATFHSNAVSVIDILVTNETNKEILSKYEQYGINVVAQETE